MYLRICFTLAILFYLQAVAYKPVVIIHGLLTGNSTMVNLTGAIEKTHPGTKVYVTDRFGSWSSLLPMWHQVKKIGADVIKIANNHPEGIHIIGYSQGGLIARGIIEAYPELNVKKFISLSSPQGGQYGTKFLHLLFPSLSCESAFELFYSVMGQEISVANYWRDPHQSPLYMDYSTYLPYINNEIQSEGSAKYRSNLEKLEKLVLFGGPDDEVITPWQSSRFGYFDKNERVVELFDQPLYQFNALGLRKLNETGRLKIVELAGVSHFQWHTNRTVIYDNLLPELD